MEKTRAEGKLIGRPVVVDSVNAELVVQLRKEGKSWAQITEMHPRVSSRSGKRVKPNVGYQESLCCCREGVDEAQRSATAIEKKREGAFYGTTTRFT